MATANNEDRRLNGDYGMLLTRVAMSLPGSGVPSLSQCMLAQHVRGCYRVINIVHAFATMASQVIG